MANLRAPYREHAEVRRAGRGRHQPLRRRHRRRARGIVEGLQGARRRGAGLPIIGPRAARAPRSWPRRWSRLATSGKAQLSTALSRRHAAAEKIHTIATQIYRARKVSPPTKRCATGSPSFEKLGFGHLPGLHRQDAISASPPIPDAYGAPTGHVLPVREVRLSAGAEFVVAICGEIMTMPGLPKVPAADSIDVDPEGRIVGLF